MSDSAIALAFVAVSIAALGIAVSIGLDRVWQQLDRVARALEASSRKDRP